MNQSFKLLIGTVLKDCLHSFVASVLLWNVCAVYSTYHLCIHDSVCSLPEATITREVRTAVATSACAIRYAYRTVNTGVVLGVHGNRTDHLNTACVSLPGTRIMQRISRGHTPRLSGCGHARLNSALLGGLLARQTNRQSESCMLLLTTG